MGKRVADIPDGEPLFDLTHLDNPHRPASFPLILALVVLGAACLWLYFVVHGAHFSDASLTSFCQLYLVVTVVCVLGKVMRRRPHNWLSPDVVFWLVFTMFHVSSVALYLLGQIDSPRRSFQFAEGVNKAMCCVVLFAIAFFLGYELGPLGRQQPAYFAPARRLPAGVFRAVQLAVVVVASVAAVLVILGIGKLLITHGYTGFRRTERHGVETGTQRVVNLSLGLLRMMITLYVAACIARHRKVLQGAFLPALVIGSILFFSVLGARSEAALAAMPLLLGYHFFVRRLRLWLGVPMLLAALLGFGILGVGRRAESLSPKEMARAYQDFRQDTGINPFVITLAEAGGSFATVVTACAFVPSQEPFWRGRSFFESLLMIIPNPVVGLRQMTASPPAWATYRMTGRRGGEQSGAGSSIAMEAYLNFGMAGGVAFMAAVGYLYRRMYDTMLRRPTFLRICLLLVTVTCLGLWCRNYSHHFLRPVSWTMIAAWLLWTGCGGAGARVQQAAVRRTTV